MAEHNIIGKRGEEVAADILRKKRFRIREMNWKIGHLEMDVIAENRKEIVFVEVKTRTSQFGGKRPEEYVDALKKRRIIVAGNAYIKMYQIDKTPRFDIIGILMDPTTGEVKETTHLENAIQPHIRTINKNSFSGAWRWLHRSKTIR